MFPVYVKQNKAPYIQYFTKPRRNLPFFGSIVRSIRRKGSLRSLTVNTVQHARVSPSHSYTYAAPLQQNSFNNKISDK